MVRGFAKYLVSHDPRTELPPYEQLPVITTVRLRPYIYTEDEIGDLIAAARRLPRLKGATYATLLGLLAATGMRVGEAIALDRNDIEWRRGSLVVRRDKRQRSRELVLHATTLAALRTYGCERDRTIPRADSASLFLSRTGTRLLYKNVHFAFLHLLRDAGLDQRQPRPRLHDLRHTFVVATLERWYREDVDIDARLPALSTYLGHVAPASTYWYLTATPELMQLARLRAEQRWSP
jgi:integrase